MRKKKIPLRKCIACSENKPKKDLIRVVRNTDSIVKVDSTGKMNGRGAYVCPDLECLDKVKKNKKLEKVLEAEIPDEVYKQLYDLIKSKQD